VVRREAESREERREAAREADGEAMFSGRKTDEFQDINTDAIIEAQQSDSHLRPVLEAVMKAGPRPPWTEVQSSPEDTRALWAQYKSLEMIDGILYRKFYQHNGTVERLQIVMPAKLRKPFLCQLHESKFNTGTAHMGIKKTQAHVSQRAYWPNWRFDVEQYCRRCTICQSVQHGIAPRHGYMQQWEANGFGDRLYVDLTGPHPASRQGSLYMMTALDAYTRFLVVVPLKNKMAVTVADALVQHWFLPFGAVRSIYSDQGSEWCNSLLAEVTKRMDIQKLRTTAYRAQSNRVERVHKSINHLLSKMISDCQKDWQDKLPMVVAAYNAACHESTGYSPYYLVYAREYRTPFDLTIEAPEAQPKNEWDYVDALQNRLQSAFVEVNKQLKATTQRMKKRYDGRVKCMQFQPGDFVWYYCPRRKQGRYQKWRRLCTIYRVEERLNDVLYRLKVSPRSRPLVAHIDRLRAFEGEPPAVWDKVLPHGRSERCEKTVGPSPASRRGSPVLESSNNHRWPAEEVDHVSGSRTNERGDVGMYSSCLSVPVNNAADTRAAEPKSGELASRGKRQAYAPRSPANDIVVSHGGELPHSLSPESISREAVCCAPPAGCTPVKSSSRLLRPPEQRRRPIRFRKVKRKNKDIIDSRVKANEFSEMSADSGNRSRRTEQQKKKRRERAKGPWFCSLCEREPFGSIAGFRSHVIVAHGKDCSWNGLISDPRDNKHRDDLIAAVRNSQRHRRNKRRRCDAAGTSEQNVEPDVERSSSSSSSPAAVSTLSDVSSPPPVIRCCRVRLSPPKPVNCESVVAPVSEASSFVAADTAGSRQSLPPNRRRSRETQTPIRGQLHLPDDVTMQYLIFV
jgi:hypothetical protein